MRVDLKRATVGASRTRAGREFQRVGAMKLNKRSPSVVHFWDNKQARVRGPQLACRDTAGQQVGEILWTCVMKGLVGKQENFESNPELYR